MKTDIIKTDCDWTLVKNSCRTTVNKEFTNNQPTTTFKKQILVSEHTPIRLINVFWMWRKIPYFVAMEWARHKFEKFISSQRNDRQSMYDRNSARQDSPVNFDGYANAQNTIDAWRKRLCYQATPEARKLAEQFKEELREYEPEWSDVLVPNCVYRCGCPEFSMCKERFFARFCKYCEENQVNIKNIQERYKAYNDFYYYEKEIAENEKI